ncbi:uncharacterized protein CGFF_05642 [Nakaseomyces glabratus]|nr:uncharacterized protein CGFF_04312 [Nakaseomyces glabratus]SLM16550.1 uncharacterized protein CGFF_05642 [Nakaseomyces glabratus]
MDAAIKDHKCVATSNDNYVDTKSWNLTHKLISSFLNTARAGSAHKDADMSVNSFFLGIGASAGYFLFQLFAFSLLRRIASNIYQSNSVLRRYENNSTLDFSNRNPSIWERFTSKCVPRIFKESIDNYEAIVGLDGFLFMRFLKKLILLFSLLSLGIVPVLIPLHLTSSDNNKNDLTRVFNSTQPQSTRIDKINMSNISMKKSDRLVGHLLLSTNDPSVEIPPTSLMVLSYHQLCQKILFNLRSFDKYFYCELKFKLQKIKPSKYFVYIPQFKRKSALEYQYDSLDREIHYYQKYLDLWLTYFPKKNEPDSSTIPGNEKMQEYSNKAFLLFNSVSQAMQFYQLLQSSSVCQWNYPMIGAHPKDIIWINIVGRNPITITLRKLAGRLIGVLVILGWIVPIAFIGLVTQIPYLTNLLPYSNHFNVTSKCLRDVTKAVFPLVTLIFLTEFVPYIFRIISYLKGCRTGAEIEMDIQRWFFMFLLVHIFFVVTISSGLSLLLEKLLISPVSIPNILAHDLPKSSNFFCSFILLRGFAYSGGNIIRLKELFFEIVYYRPRMPTPHNKMQRLKKNLFFQWGSIYPLFTVIGCICIIYSIIAPFILPLAVLSLSLVYYSFKYLFIYQFNSENISETHGKLYPEALSQLYAGIYCMEFSLIGLFALFNCYKLSTSMAFMSILTVLIHAEISKKFIRRLHNLHLNNLHDYTSSDSISPRAESLESYIFPPITNEIWVPTDQMGIAENERPYLQASLSLKCDFEKAYITKFGNICINPDISE